MVRTAWVLTAVVAVTLGSAVESSATPVTLIGVNGSGVTA